MSIQHWYGPPELSMHSDRHVLASIWHRVHRYGRDEQWCTLQVIHWILAIQARTDAPPIWLREQVERLVDAGYLEARETDNGRQYRLTCGPDTERGERAMPRVLTVVIPGRPVPKARMTQRSKWADPRARECLAYQQRVRVLAAMAAKRAGLVHKSMARHDSVFAGPVRVDWTAHIAKRRGGTPDRDNIEKTVLDGLQPEIICSDNIGRVPQGSSDVVYGVPNNEQRLEVIITELTNETAAYMRRVIADAIDVIGRTG